MDELLQSLVAGAPNLAVALVVLYWQHRQIKELVCFQRRIIEHLLSLPADDQKETD